MQIGGSSGRQAVSTSEPGLCRANSTSAAEPQDDRRGKFTWFCVEGPSSRWQGWLSRLIYRAPPS
jgi:hypothetical protein